MRRLIGSLVEVVALRVLDNLVHRSNCSEECGEESVDDAEPRRPPVQLAGRQASQLFLTLDIPRIGKENSVTVGYWEHSAMDV